MVTYGPSGVWVAGTGVSVGISVGSGVSVAVGSGVAVSAGASVFTTTAIDSSVAVAAAAPKPPPKRRLIAKIATPSRQIKPMPPPARTGRDTPRIFGREPAVGVRGAGIDPVPGPPTVALPPQIGRA